jgi:hypothetical protein
MSELGSYNSFGYFIDAYVFLFFRKVMMKLRTICRKIKERRERNKAQKFILVPLLI